MRLILRDLAKEDLQEAGDWYSALQSEVGQRFLLAAQDAFRSIRQNPLIYPRVSPEIRRASLSHFPYGVFYRVDPDAVRILAILHNARDPGRWKGRR